MRIVLIITDFGSFNNFLAELAVDMNKNNHQVHVISSGKKVINRNDKYDYEQLGIKLHNVNFPRGFNFYKHYQASVEIHKIIDAIDPDLVHIHFTTGIFTTVFVKKPKYLTIGTFHGLGYPVLEGMKRKIFKSVEYFCFNRLDQLWVLNKFDYDIIKAVRPKKAFIYKSLGLGCDLDRFDPTKFDDSIKVKIKEELDIRPDDFVISYTGRFVDFKGFHLTVRSFLAIHKKHKNIKLILMGGRDSIHPTGLTPAEESEMNNCEGIINIGFTNEIEKYLAISDVFVFPSIKEGMPVCIIEALAMNIPVISSDSRGCNDLVTDGFNGYLVSNPPNVKDIEDKIMLLLRNPEKRDELSRNASSQRSDYDRENYIKEQFGIYTELIENLKEKKNFPAI